MTPIKKTILIVDDETELRAILREFLGRRVVTILEADSGQKAVQVLKEHRVDVIISDMRMPNGDGLFLVEALRSLQPMFSGRRPQLLLLSAYADLPANTEEKLRDIPLMGKPFQLSRMWELIEKWLKAD